MIAIEKLQYLHNCLADSDDVLHGDVHI